MFGVDENLNFNELIGLRAQDVQQMTTDNIHKLEIKGSKLIILIDFHSPNVSANIPC